MKLKKVISGLLLFGIVLIPCFSNAVNNVNDLGQYEDLGGNLCTINSDLSFDCDNSNNVIVGTDSSWYKTSSSYFRTSSGLAYYIYSNSRIFDNGQGYITSFDICGSYDFPNCNSQISYQDFLTYFSNNELTNWEWYSSATTPGRAGPVFIFGDTRIFVAPVTSDGNNIYLWHGGITPYSFGLVGWGLEANYQGVIDTPFPEDTSGEDVSEVIFYSDNNQVYFDFLTLLGYNTGLCYGDFELTEIVILDGSYYQFFPDDVNTGANIFTLRSNWYSNFDSYSWYGQIRGLYNITTKSNDFTPYMGKSRGFYRLAYKVENQSYFSAYQPNGTDLFIYCDMALNGYDPNGLFTGNLSPSATNIFINSDYRNSYREDNNGEFVLSGSNEYFSGDEVGFFDLFNHLYTRFKNGFSVNPTNTGFTGILPTFVIFGFFLILLLYGLKR